MTGARDGIGDCDKARSLLGQDQVTHSPAPTRRKTRGRVQLMGIVNRTPDSFFDGGQWLGDDAGRARALAVLRAGADVLDVGAESTRPGAAAVPAAEQI